MVKSPAECRAARLFALAILCGTLASTTAADDWFRVKSSDGMASVLFPNAAEDPRELVDKTPGGKVVTRVAEYQADGILMTISVSTLPKMVMRFAGSKVILKNARANVVSKAYGTELSSESIDIPGATAAEKMRYEAPDLEHEGHPGYTGLAIFVIFEKKIYVVNSAISKHTPDNEAMQQKLFGSLHFGGGDA